MSREENRKNFYKYVSQNILGMMDFPVMFLLIHILYLLQKEQTDLQH